MELGWLAFLYCTRRKVLAPSGHPRIKEWLTFHTSGGCGLQVWAKNRPGLGQYFRGRHELCLFGVRRKGRGTVHRTESRAIQSVIEAPRLAHSVKPSAFFDLVEARSAGPYLEMFARRAREGWTCWGSEL